MIDFGQGKTLILPYSGLGDTLINSSIFSGFSHSHHTQWLYPENPIISYLSKKGLAVPCTVGKNMRTVLLDLSQEQRETISRSGIKNIISLRKDFFQKNADIYFHHKKMLSDMGIQVIDFLDFFTEEKIQNSHIFDLHKEFFQNLGLNSATAGLHGWLMSKSEQKQTHTIGLFLGGSTKNKRLSISFWNKLIARLYEDWNLNIIVFFGNSEEEKQEGRMLLKKIPTNIPIRTVSDLSLEDLEKEIQTLPFLIVTDSFLLHFAESLGVNTFSLHTSTDPRVYGPQSLLSGSVGSDNYLICEYRNKLGNCYLWGSDCQSPPCQSYLSDDFEKIVSKMKPFLTHL